MKKENLIINAMNGVSIVICCYNSAKRITPTLEHIQKINAHGIPWEVILVDNCSDDETILVSLSVWEENPVTTLRIVSEKNKGLMHARLAGMRNTKYDFVSFIDDDNWVESEWVSKVFRIMNSDESIAACGGSSQPVFETNPPDWFSEYSADCAVGRQQNNDGFVNPEKDSTKRYLWGAGMTVRKKAWNDLFENGFTSLLKGRTGKTLTAGEDSEICSVWVLKGWNLWYEDSLRLKHYMPSIRLNVSYLAAMYRGFGQAEVILSQYKGHIHPHLVNKNSWFVQSLIAIRNMTKAGLKNLISSRGMKVRNKIIWNHERAYAAELIFNRDKFYMVKELIEENTSKNTYDPQIRRELVA